MRPADFVGIRRNCPAIPLLLAALTLSEWAASSAA